MSETPKLSAEAELMLLFGRSDAAEKARMYRDSVTTAQGLSRSLEADRAEITKLKSQLEEARAAIRDYLDEIDAPVKDYALRTVFRNKLRALLNGSAK